MNSFPLYIFAFLASFFSIGFSQWLAPSDTIRLIFGGDVMLGRSVEKQISATDADYPWRGISDYLRSADLAVVNLECPVGALTRHIRKEYVFQANPAVLQGLTDAGIDAVSIANNHIYDYFGEGVVQTVQNLEKVGIVHIGGGRNANEFMSPRSFWIRGNWFVLFGLNDTKAGFWGVENPGCSPTWTDWGESVSVAAVEKMADLGAIIIVIEHWGWEYDLHPRERQIELGHKLIDAGAKAVIGSHPHRVQGIEFYNGGMIAYSLGNLVFDQKDSLGNIGALMQLEFVDGKADEIELLPIETITRFAQPHPFSADSMRITIHELSSKFNVDAKVIGEWLIF